MWNFYKTFIQKLKENYLKNTTLFWSGTCVYCVINFFTSSPFVVSCLFRHTLRTLCLNPRIHCFTFTRMLTKAISCQQKLPQLSIIFQFFMQQISNFLKFCQNFLWLFFFKFLINSFDRILSYLIFTFLVGKGL